MANELFLSNFSKIKFIDRLHECFKTCKSFSLTVSFIKYAGLSFIRKDIEDALERGVVGKIITTTYKNFTDVPSLTLFKQWADKYNNFEAHLDHKSFDNRGYHSKGYLFEMDNHYEFLVGSTNITTFALKRNIEWNLSTKLNYDDQALLDALTEFKLLWNSTEKLTQEIIDEYQHEVEFAIECWDMDGEINPNKKFKPNAMQLDALKELKRYRKLGVSKALVIASTGSGKTYLAAFDAFDFNPDRLLFVVHRDTILVEARNTFANVFGPSRTYGFVTGKDKNPEADFVFATNKSLSDHLDMFNKDDFDYIVMDECHHVAASTYRKIMNYFDAQFILGLTATPERMDDQNVFDLFDKNVPYELRLRDAIKNELVVPFHYYGIRDEEVDYSDNANKNVFLNNSYSDKHIEFIVEQIEKYRVRGQKLKCVTFCRSIEHAQMMASKMHEVGYGTKALTGKSDTYDRLQAYEALQDETNQLEIIFTVDILNEGINIPGINMVVFLRPTQSQTIFIQQLGRGLRKYDNKEFLTVLDFIGNSYDRSVQVALALGGLTPNAYIEKPLLDSLVRDNFKSLDIPGVEIYFDELSQDQILSYIEHTNFNTIKILKQDFLNFKQYLKCETYPSHMDFLEADCAPDLMRLLKSKNNGRKNRSYYNFLKAIDIEFLPYFDKDEINVIDQLSELLPLTRKEEYLIIKNIMNNIQYNVLDLDYSRGNSSTMLSALNILLKLNIIKDDDNKYSLNIDHDLSEDFIDYMNDLLEYGLTRYDKEFGNFDGMFKLEGNYQSQQISMEIDGTINIWQKGTRIDSENKVAYLFVALKKDEKIDATLKYKDKFLSPDTFQWSSEKGVTLTNTIGRKLQEIKTVHLFIRKVKTEDGIQMPFTYFGTGRFMPNPKPDMNEGSSVLLFEVKLDHPVDKELRYDFLVPEEEIFDA